MRWFKHLTSLRNHDAAGMRAKWGLEGYGFFVMVLEIIAENMDGTDRCSATLPQIFWANSIGISIKKFRKFAEFLSIHPDFSVDISDDWTTIQSHKLLELRDEYSRKQIRNLRRYPDIPSQMSGKNRAEENRAEEKRAEQRQRLPFGEDIENSTPEQVEEAIVDICSQLQVSGIFTEASGFARENMDRNRNWKAIFHSLLKCLINNPKHPWAYCEKILGIEEGNFNARDYQKSHGKDCRSD